DDPNAVDVVVTVNAAADPVEVHYAVTATSVGVRPVDSAAAWTYGATANASSTVRVRSLPQGTRVWIRARSRSTGTKLKLPSAWVYLGAPGYVTMGTITAPSAVA